METLFMLDTSSGYRCEPIEKSELDTPRIEMTADTYAKIKNIIDMSPLEVGWLSHVSISNNIYRIDSCEIVEQKVMSAETEMTTQGLQDFMQNTIKKKGVKYFNDVRCWGHSHVNMGVSPSGQDQKQILAWKESEYEIMLIMNKKGDLYSALYDFKNNKKHIGLPVHIVFDGFSEKQKKEISKELKKKVEERKWEPHTPFYLMQNANFDKQIVSDPFFVADEKTSTESVSQLLKQESMLEDEEGFVEVEESFKNSPSAIALSANRIHTALSTRTIQSAMGYTMDIDDLCIVLQELTDCLFYFDEIDYLVSEGAVRDVAAVLFAAIGTIADSQKAKALSGWLSLEAPEVDLDLNTACEWVSQYINQADAQILHSILDKEFSFESFANFIETLI